MMEQERDALPRLQSSQPFVSYAYQDESLASMPKALMESGFHFSGNP